MNTQISQDPTDTLEAAQLDAGEVVQLPLSTLALIGGGQAIVSFY